MKKLFFAALISLQSLTAFAGPCDYLHNDLYRYRDTYSKPILKDLIAIEKRLTRFGYDAQDCRNFSYLSGVYNRSTRTEIRKSRDIISCFYENYDFYQPTINQLVRNMNGYIENKREQRRILRDIERSYCN